VSHAVRPWRSLRRPIRACADTTPRSLAGQGVSQRDVSLAELTPREREVLALVAEGLSNKAIAERLFVAERAVETHVKQIFMKLRLDPSADTHRRVLAVLACLRAESAA
jgi:DNA-binding NarL/FixJ family response regulator